MKVAVTVWEGTVSTVCDFASGMLVFDVMDGGIKNRSFIPVEAGTIPERVGQLEALGIEILLCGAISRPLERRIRASGVQVIPCLRGSIEEVIGAYLNGSLSDARFILPGFFKKSDGACGGKRRCCRTVRSPNEGAEDGNGKGDSNVLKKNPTERTNKMKVAITASGVDLNSPVDRVFGRARYFVLTDPEGLNLQVVENSQNINAAQGAGIQAARQVAEQSVDVVLSGNVGPNAFRALAAASLRVFQFGGEILTVRNALAAWKDGGLPEVKAPTAEGHGF